MFHILSPRMFVQMPAGWLQPMLSTSSKKINTTLALKEAEAPNGISCPYEYILDLYGKNGKNHFEKIIRWLDPALEEEDPAWFALILEIMDVVHFGLILVDDVEDNSMLRKGRPAAHMVYGSAETINRSYLRIFEIVKKCGAMKPSAVSFLLDNLAQIHKGRHPKKSLDLQITFA
jgi:geranylgeranyl pyrophosphate synthase